MNEKEQNEDKNTQENQAGEETCTPCEKGTANLLVGGGFAVYGTAVATAAGAVCPVCVVAAPLFLGLGAVQRYRYQRKKKNPDDEA